MRRLIVGIEMRAALDTNIVAYAKARETESVAAELGNRLLKYQ